MSKQKHTKATSKKSSKPLYPEAGGAASGVQEEQAAYSDELKAGLIAVSNMKPKN